MPTPANLALTCGRIRGGVEYHHEMPIAGHFSTETQIESLIKGNIATGRGRRDRDRLHPLREDEIVRHPFGGFATLYFVSNNGMHCLSS